MIDQACQMTLGLREKPCARDRARDDAAFLVRTLEARPELRGVRAETLCAALEWTDRRLRGAAEASGGEVLSAPGCTGYRLARHTPVESYYTTERAHYRSQINLMTARLLAMDKAVHRGSSLVR
jgi:hypothetical protein